MAFADRLVDAWYAPRLTPLTAALVPPALAFGAVASLRRALYRRGLLRTQRMPVPVVVVGNITVGGSGKTPLAAALTRALAERGWHPGIVSRGHGRADPGSPPRVVAPDADADAAGDEPLLLARTGVPVAVGADRAAAARALLAARPDCDVIVADDGLQHYALARDFEIVVVDAGRGLGNGWRLPAGPLREPAARLDEADAVVALVTAGAPAPWLVPNAWRMTLEGDAFVRVADRSQSQPVSAFAGPGVHAVAGIGNPERFFTHLRSLGIAPTVHAFPDHHRFVARDLVLPGARAILMTEKDAVKCEAFADERCWYLPVRAHIDPALVTRVEEALHGSEAP
ncbi:MAG TPA: tetraacyldisaccharide 4'-kinase [Casimicrobiaceae bacterium]|nr:tetraacyldisaccharide 4'-kinase [Casimicrobiaceae bacterium]